MVDSIVIFEIWDPDIDSSGGPNSTWGVDRFPTSGSSRVF